MDEVTKNLNQVKRDTDCGAIAKGKKPHRAGVPLPAWKHGGKIISFQNMY